MIIVRYDPEWGTPVADNNVAAFVDKALHYEALHPGSMTIVGNILTVKEFLNRIASGVLDYHYIQFQFGSKRLHIDSYGNPTEGWPAMLKRLVQC